MPNILISTAYEDGPAWYKIVSEERPNWTCRLWSEGDDINDPWLKEVDYLIAAKPAEGLLPYLPKLKAIHSLWAGVEHITQLPDYDASHPIIRMVDEEMTRGMVEFVVGRVLYYHNRMHEYAEHERNHHWYHDPKPLAFERRVGILGLGTLGQAVAHCLVGFDFKVAGWSRSLKDIDGVESFAGPDGFDQLMKQSEILVCLLPRTPDTEDILNKRGFDLMPKGACLINVARGEHLVVDDMLEAMKTGHIAHATLDVFRKEPLSETCPYWDHPQVTVTPHIASDTRLGSGSRTVLRNLDRLIQGEDLSNLAGVVDPRAGY